MYVQIKSWPYNNSSGDRPSLNILSTFLPLSRFLIRVEPKVLPTDHFNHSFSDSGDREPHLENHLPADHDAFSAFFYAPPFVLVFNVNSSVCLGQNFTFHCSAEPNNYGIQLTLLKLGKHVEPADLESRLHPEGSHPTPSTSLIDMSATTPPATTPATKAVSRASDENSVNQHTYLASAHGALQSYLQTCPTNHGTGMVAMANTKQAREFLEAWHSSTTSINRHVDLDSHYEGLHARFTDLRPQPNNSH
ncbi:unnamed protein product [Schistocephalus solidus]|uniref:Uncharacterized protein n=1 Tax=Schistocephalus solidus TaxID=70667 RepID=A0A3P7CNH7_SCHSO|nr:unnamed protein product [Schistocephalus solidus]